MTTAWRERREIAVALGWTVALTRRYLNQVGAVPRPGRGKILLYSPEDVERARAERIKDTNRQFSSRPAPNKQGFAKWKI